jgi:hypothetical protein
VWRKEWGWTGDGGGGVVRASGWEG